MAETEVCSPVSRPGSARDAVMLNVILCQISTRSSWITHGICIRRRFAKSGK